LTLPATHCFEFAVASGEYATFHCAGGSLTLPYDIIYNSAIN